MGCIQSLPKESVKKDENGDDMDIEGKQTGYAGDIHDSNFRRISLSIFMGSSIENIKNIASISRKSSLDLSTKHRKASTKAHKAKERNVKRILTKFGNKAIAQSPRSVSSNSFKKTGRSISISVSKLLYNTWNRSQNNLIQPDLLLNNMNDDISKNMPKYIGAKPNPQKVSLQLYPSDLNDRDPYYDMSYEVHLNNRLFTDVISKDRGDMDTIHDDSFTKSDDHYEFNHSKLSNDIRNILTSKKYSKTVTKNKSSLENNSLGLMLPYPSDNGTFDEGFDNTMSTGIMSTFMSPIGSANNSLKTSQENHTVKGSSFSKMDAMLEDQTAAVSNKINPYKTMSSSKFSYTNSSDTFSKTSSFVSTTSTRSSIISPSFSNESLMPSTSLILSSSFLPPISHAKAIFSHTISPTTTDAVSMSGKVGIRENIVNGSDDLEPIRSANLFTHKLRSISQVLKLEKPCEVGCFDDGISHTAESTTKSPDPSSFSCKICHTAFPSVAEYSDHVQYSKIHHIAVLEYNRKVHDKFILREALIEMDREKMESRKNSLDVSNGGDIGLAVAASGGNTSVSKPSNRYSPSKINTVSNCMSPKAVNSTPRSISVKTCVKINTPKSITLMNTTRSNRIHNKSRSSSPQYIIKQGMTQELTASNELDSKWDDSVCKSISSTTTSPRYGYQSYSCKTLFNNTSNDIISQSATASTKTVSNLSYSNDNSIKSISNINIGPSNTVLRAGLFNVILSPTKLYQTYSNKNFEFPSPSNFGQFSPDSVANIISPKSTTRSRRNSASGVNQTPSLGQKTANLYRFGGSPRVAPLNLNLTSSPDTQKLKRNRNIRKVDVTDDTFMKNYGMNFTPGIKSPNTHNLEDSQELMDSIDLTASMNSWN